jgi:hypothetical protein
VRTEDGQVADSMKADSGVNQAGRTRVGNQTAAPHLCQSAPVLRGSSPFVVSGQGRGRKGNRKDRGPRMSRSTTGRHGQAAARHDDHEASGIMWFGRVGGSKPSSIAAFVKGSRETSQDGRASCYEMDAG